MEDTRREETDERKDPSDVHPSSSCPSFSEAFRFWLKLGFISFGGPAGQIAVMQREMVDNRKWVAQDDFLHALNYCMLLPGPEAQQLATYIGWRLHGIKGGIVAGAFFVIPSIFFLLILSSIYVFYGNVPEISAVLNGFKAIVVAIVVEAILKIAGKAFKSYWQVFIAGLSFVAIYFFHVPFPLIILGAGVLGVFLSNSKIDGSKSNDGRYDFPEFVSKTKYPTVKISIACLLLWVLPFFSLAIFVGYEDLLTKNYLFFTQAAFVTFGGAYAVLAYVNQSVVSSGWITPAQAVDGLALAETTPGPLIMVLQFIGFMIGWNNPSFSSRFFSAAISGLLATYATFLPSFFFILAGAPYIDRLRHSRKLNSALSGVTAAVVGVILNLALTFGAAVILPDMRLDFFALALFILSFAALYFFKINVLIVVIAGGLCGLLKFFVS